MAIYVIIIKLRKVLLNWDLVHLTFTTLTINLPISMRFQAPVPGVEIKYSQAWSIKKFPGHLNQIFN